MLGRSRAVPAPATLRHIARAPHRHLLLRHPPVLHEISQSLETGLDQETLAILLALCEQGVNPEALAAVVKELRRETAALHAAADGRQGDENNEPPVFG